VPNYDETRREPTVLPSRIPNLMVNGSNGIAVGMATNIPPHNLGEVVDAIVAVIENPQATADDLMAFIKGPTSPPAASSSARLATRRPTARGAGASASAPRPTPSNSRATAPPSSSPSSPTR